MTPRPSTGTLQTAPTCDRGYVNPFARPSKTDYERHLNDLPVPEKLPPSLIMTIRKPPAVRAFGTWLRQHNLPLFNRRFEAWKAAEVAAGRGR